MTDSDDLAVDGEYIEQLIGGSPMSDSDQTRPVLDPPDNHVSRPPTTYLWQIYDPVVDGDDCR